ncbi:putative eukaryotic initiation factor 4a [Trypanosoma grayi]|uniref:putative eukaryotic initiation factor 4a n=1 Tax=Trypanosoma grayi TaxID=71804 RepID=UPI0004F4B6D4|nr:putative eukaryotic initiation factor 4a [Trypanosoma grayi]KEG13937.1 putative eukaryotic initiation factor 4a [Trypanosoma grayi]
MLTATPGPLTLATSEAWKPSVFRPPARLMRATPPSKNVLTATARPWYPHGNAPREPAAREHRLVPPPALGQSPTLTPSLEDIDLPPVSSCSAISPLSTPVSTCFHRFTQPASEERVYPMDMFMSVRHDAAHTPYGVLHWAVKQYLQIPSLKVPRHLQLSLHEVVSPNDGVTRGALGSSLKGRARAKPVRLTHHKVMSILSRLTPVKYDALRDEMMLLPLRQTEDAELMEICKVVFEKAVQEPSYSGLYARLVNDICSIKDGDRDVEARDRNFSRRFRRLLIESCEAQFQRPLQLSADELVDRTTGTPLCEEEVEMKRGRLKARLVGNIRFVAELFNIGLLTERVIEDVVRILVRDYDPDMPTAKEESVFEVFVTLVRHTGALLKELLPNLLAQALGIAKTIELSHPKPRVTFLMMDLDDLNRANGWVSPEMVQRHVRLPKNNNNTSASPRKGSNVVSPLSLSSFAAVPVDKGTRTSAQTSEVFVSKRLCNGKDPIGNNKSFVSTMNSNGNSVSEANGSRNDFSTSACMSGNNNTSNANNNNIDDNKNSNSNTSDALKSPSRAAERVRRGQHQPYSSLTLTRIVSGSESQFSASFNPAMDNSPITPVRGGSDYAMPYSPPQMHQGSETGCSGTASEGLGSPWASRGKTPLTDTMVNIKEITKQLMGLFRKGEETAAIKMLRDMGLKNMVVCLTWWLRLAATNTSYFEDRSKVASLLSSLLRTCSGAYDTKTVFSTELEWIRFDLEKGEYDNCPRMFDNFAQMILQCHLPCSDALPHIEVVRNMMHCGLFNVLLRELTINGGTDQMVTVVKSCYPVSQQLLNNLHDPEDERQILRIAVQNRFRLLPYLLSVSSVTNNAMPGTPSSRPRMTSSPMRNSPLGDSFTGTGHYDPLAQCVVFPRISDDPEFVLFRKLRDEAADGGAAARWCGDAVNLALSPLGNNSTVCELIAVMRVVGALLVCSSVSYNNGRMLALPSDVDHVVGEVLSKRPGILHQGAVVMELVMYHTQTLNDTCKPSTVDVARLRPLKRVFDHWCASGVINRKAVLDLLSTLENAADAFSVYTAYHDCVADVPWADTLKMLKS